MKFLNKTAAALSAVFLLFSSPAQADYCPDKIAAIDGDPLAIEGVRILREVYSKLGCPLRVVYLPGRRGVLQFNQGEVDGEIYRLRLVEGAYMVKFVRSSKPLFKLTNALWENPSPDGRHSKAMGYVLGIKWHEAYVKENLDDIPHLIRFHTEEKLYEAYNRGEIGSFLTEKQSIDLMNKNTRFLPPPKMKKAISSSPLYHYLNDRFAPFMANFSIYLEERNPFDNP